MPGDSFVIKAPSVQQELNFTINGEDKLISFSKLLNNIANGSKLQDYWGTQERMIRRVTDAYGQFVQVANQKTGGELIKSMNALKAMAGDDIPNVLSNYTRISRAFEEASANFGHAFTEYSVPNFKEVFASINDMKAFGLETEEVFKRLGSSTDVQRLQQQVEQLTQTCSFLRAAVRDLEEERDKLLNGSEIRRLREIEEQFNSLKNTMANEFQSFLVGSDMDADRWGQFSEYFDQIYDGSMTAKEAITLVRQQLVEMFREGQNITAGDTVFSSTQMQEFISKLDDACIKVEQMRQDLQDLTSGAALRNLTDQMIESSEYTEKQRDALKELVSQGAGISSVAELLGALIQNFDTTDEKVRTSVDAFRGLLEVLNQIAQVEPANMSGFNDVLKNIHSLQSINIDTKRMESLAASLKMLGDIPSLPNLAMLGSVDLRGFNDIKVSKASMSNLAEYLPTISTQVDIGKLQALSQISLSNFSKENLSVSNAAFKHLQELLQQIQGTSNNDAFAQYDYGAGTSGMIDSLEKVAQKAREERQEFKETNAVLQEHTQDAEAAAQAEEDKKKISELLAKALEKEEESTRKSSEATKRASEQESQYVNTTMKRVFDMQRSIEDARVGLGKLTDGSKRPEYRTYSELIGVLEEVIQKYYKYQEVIAANPDNPAAATQVFNIADVWSTIADVAMQFAEARENVNMFTHQTKDGMAQSKVAARELQKEMDLLAKIIGKDSWDIFSGTLQKIKRDFEAIKNPSDALRQKYSDLEGIINVLSDKNADPSARLAAFAKLRDAIEGVTIGIRNETNAQRDAVKSQNELQKSATDAANEIERLDKIFKSLGDKTKFDTSSFERMRELLAQVNNQNLSADQRKSALQDLNALLEESSKKLHAVAAAEKERAAETKAGTAADNKKANLLKQMNGLLDQCTNAERKFAAAQNVDAVKQSYSALKNTTEEVRALISQLQSGSISMEDAAVKARNLGVAFSKANTELKTNSSLFGRYLTTGMQQLKSRLTYSLGLAAMVYKAVGEVKKMVSTAVELDSAMNTLQIVTRASGHEMEEYGRRISSMAKETAQATKDLIDATTVYARLGYSMDESATLSKYTAMLQGVGDIGASEAQNAMTAIIKAFGKNVNDIEDVMDKLVVVGNNFPISVSQLAEGMNNAGSMLAVAGNSFEESIALLTAANTTIQNISKASTGLRTIAARIRKTTTGEDDDGEIVEEAKYQEMINALTKQHVSLVDEVTGEYRSTYDIIRDIAKVWKDMSSMEQAAVVEALAGTRQQNIFASLMTQFGEAEAAMDRMNDSAGELKSSYNIYLDSINAHVKTLSAAFSELSKDFVDSDLAKWAVDLLTNLIELLDLLINKIGALGTVLSISALPGIIKMISSRSFASSLTQLIGMFGMLKSSSTALTTVGTTAASISGSIPIIMAFVAALSTLQHVLQRINQDRQHNISELYTKSISSAKEERAIYDLYAAYEDARIKQDETEESKRRLKQASEDLAVALGYEKEAADSLNESFAQMSVAQLEKAVSDAKIATDAASREFLEVINDPRNTSFLDSLFGNTNYNEEQFLNIFANKNGIDLVEANNPLSKQTNEERARSLMQVYELMIERQKELSDANETTTKEYQQLSDTIVWMKPQVDKLKSSMDLYAESQENINDIIRGTTDPAKKLGKALDSLSDNAVKSLLTGELNDENLEEIQAVMKEYYSTPEKMMNEILGNSDVVMKRVSKPYEDAKAELVKVQEDIAQKGIDINQTAFGNIDTNNRQVLEWTQDNLNRFSQELQSWGKDANSMAGTISTVLGGSNNYNGVEIAFSPILQTDDGPVLLSQETVNDYIVSLIEELNEQKGEWTTEDLFELDARGIERDGKKINKIIADVGATAKKTGESMHYLGKDGALALAQRGLQEAKGFLDLFTKEITPDGITNATEKSVAELATLRDELSETTKALEEYKTAMEGGEKDDAVKQAAEIYKGAIEDITSGRVDTNRLHAAAKLFFSDEFLNSINWDMERVGRELQNNMWKYLFDPDEQSALDYGQRFAEYVEQNFSRANGVWMEGGNFYYHSLESVAKAFNMSTEAATMFLSALDMYGVNTMRSTEENYKLISSFYTLESKLNDTEAAVREIVKQMDTEGMDEVEIHAVLDDLQKTGVIDLNSEELHAAISNVLDELHNVDEQKPEPTVGLKYDDVIDGVNTIYRILNELVNSGPWIIPISMPEYSTEDKDNNNNNNNKNSTNGKSGTQGDADAGGKHAGSGGGKTLVNEEGPELISDNGKAFFANGGKPGFVYLSKDAIVFNADETEEILKHGTVRGAIPAHAGGTGVENRSGLIGRLLGGKSYPAKRQVQGTQVGGNSQTPKQEPVTYWTCPFCGYLNPQTVSYCQSCGRDPRRSVTTTQQTVGTQTITVYQPTADSLQYTDWLYDTTESDRDYEYAEQQARMREQEEKARRDLEELQREKERLAAQKVDKTPKTPTNKGLTGSGGGNNVGGSDYASQSDPTKVDWIAVRINRLQRSIADLEKVATSGFKMLDTRLNAAKKQIQETTKELEVQDQAYSRYLSEANKVGLDESIAQKARDGTIDINEYDADTRKKIDEYMEWYEKALDAKSSVEELHQAIAQLYLDIFENVKTNYENQLSEIEHNTTMIEKNMEMAQTKGYLDSAKFYEQLSESESESLNKLNIELAELKKRQQEAMDSGKIEKGSEAWYQMQQAIREVEEAIADSNIKLQQYEKTVRQINWGHFDYAMERLSQVNQETGFLIDLMSHHPLFQENGRFNELGEATAGLHAVNYDVYMAQADEYAKEIEKIQRDLEKDPYDTELIARRETLLGLQRQSIQSAEQEKEAVKSLVQEGINLELQSLKDLIDAYEKSLDSAKDLYEYQKKVAEKTADIAAIQKQLAAYQNDTSEETRARVQKLTKDLKSAQTDLTETERDQSISDQKKLLDDLYDEYEDYMNTRLDNIDLLMQEIINGTNANLESIRTTLVETSDEVGYSITDKLQQVMSNNLGYYDQNHNDINSVHVVLSNIYDMVAAMARASGAVKAYATGGLVDYTGLAAVHGTKRKPELMLNASDTENFLEAAKMLRSAAMAPSINAMPNLYEGISGLNIGQFMLNIPIERVQDYNDFVTQLQSDTKFERLINAMTLDRMAGKSVLGKNRIIF